MYGVDPMYERKHELSVFSSLACFSQQHALTPFKSNEKDRQAANETLKLRVSMCTLVLGQVAWILLSEFVD